METGLVSSSAAFLLCEQCVVLSQQRRFESGCWSYPTKGVELGHSLLMKLPLCCCCCLFFVALWVTASQLGDLLYAGMPEGSQMCGHMYVYICSLLEHSTFD